MSAYEFYTVPFTDIAIDDVGRVGGKNASLGELTTRLNHAGVAVPDGFAVAVEAYWDFLMHNGLCRKIKAALDSLEPDHANLAAVGRTIRRHILQSEIPVAIANEIGAAYRDICARAGGVEIEIAVRSSATAEDLPDASFAGQQDTFLNVGDEASLIECCKRCFASLFSDRAIAYRAERGFEYYAVAMSIGVQRMVRSDLGCAGVMFTIDTETGFPDAILINGAWGLGELVVQGAIDPDEFMVFKPLLSRPRARPIIDKTLGTKTYKMIYGEGAERVVSVETDPTERARFVLSDNEVLTLARTAQVIETHYGRPMDIEWAKDGRTGELFIVQARPETVQSRRDVGALKAHRIVWAGTELLSGCAIGDGVATGKVCVLETPGDAHRFEDGCILVTPMTDPDWLPLMKRAAAVVTDNGGRTSHAAIVSREMGLPAVTGCGHATQVLRGGQEVTVCCAQGATGRVFDGIAEYEVTNIDLSDIQPTKTKVMLNMANPKAAMRWWKLPADGIGLVRMEFIVSNLIGCHPMALARYDSVSDPAVRRRIDELTVGYPDKAEYFVDKLSLGLALIAAVSYPKQVIVRMSDFKTNEYADLVGGAGREPKEENPMIGWRGASRYCHHDYRDGFRLECAAVKRVRDVIGLSNVVVMVPFCRTTKEADRVLAEMADAGLVRSEGGLEIYMMCEVPSNVMLADLFATRFDGFSIGSNDLTQLILGVDRDSTRLIELFDERNPAILLAIRTIIREAHAQGRKVGLCGQGPSDRADFAADLVEAGIDSVSVTPDSFIDVKRIIAESEAKRRAPKPYVAAAE